MSKAIETSITTHRAGLASIAAVAAAAPRTIDDFWVWRASFYNFAGGLVGAPFSTAELLKHVVGHWPVDANGITSNLPSVDPARRQRHGRGPASKPKLGNGSLAGVSIHMN